MCGGGTTLIVILGLDPGIYRLFFRGIIKTTKYKEDSCLRRNDRYFNINKFDLIKKNI